MPWWALFGVVGDSMTSTGPVSNKLEKDCYMCLLCELPIKEATSRRQGDDAIVCSGSCGGWLHRHCAGLTKAAYMQLSSSDEPFHCARCMLRVQDLEIQALREQVASLFSELSAMKQSKSSEAPSGGYAAAVGSNPVRSGPTADGLEMSGNGSDAKAPGSSPSAKQVPLDERRFNVVLFGLEESERGASRHSRLREDMDKVAKLIASIDESLSAASVRDQFRLGKLKANSDRPRPILVKFVRAVDATCLLSRTRDFKKPVFIKPDLSPDQRRRESILLKERWSLIESGVSRSRIKIRNSKLYLDKAVFGFLTSDNVFHRAPSQSQGSPGQAEFEDLDSKGSASGEGDGCPVHLSQSVASDHPAGMGGSP